MRARKVSRDSVTPLSPERRSFFDRKKILVYIIGLGLILLMVSSIISYSDFGGSLVEQEYGGYQFVQTDQGLWRFYYQNQPLEFFYFPSELAWLQVPSYTFQSKIYVVSDTAVLSSLEFQRFTALLRFTNHLVVPACFTEENCSGDLPLVTCEQQGASVLSLRYTNQTALSVSESCLLLDMQQSDERAVVERLAYSLFGVML